MGNLIEGGNYSGSPVQPTVSRSPAVENSEVSGSGRLTGVSNYANRIENYTGDFNFGMPMMMPYPMFRGKRSHHGHRDKEYGCGSGYGRHGRYDEFAMKNYEKNPPPSRAGEALNVIKTNEAIRNKLREKANAKGFLGFSGQLNEQDVKDAASTELGKMGFSSGDIDKAAKNLVESERGSVDNWSKWGTLLGVPAAILGAFLFPAIGKGLVQGGAKKAAIMSTAPFAHLGVRPGPMESGLSGAGTILTSLLGFFGLGGAAATLGSSLDGHGDAGLSREDVDKMAAHQSDATLPREQAGDYYEKICRTKGRDNCKRDYTSYKRDYIA